MEAIIDTIFNSMNDIKKEKSYISDIFKIHKYWARKPWYVVSKYIEKYSKNGDLVVDPFCGSGLTGIESIYLNRNFLGIDLNPMSTFISEMTLLTDVDINSLKSDFDKISELCKHRILDLYKNDLKCEKCNSSLYVKDIICDGANKGKANLFCNECGFKKTVQLDDIEYDGDLDFTNLWTPNVEMPKKFFKDRFSYKGIHNVNDFYSKRNLFALCLLKQTILSLKTKNEKLLLIAFSNTVLHSSKLKGSNVRPMSVNNYWIPTDFIEENVWIRFEDRFKNLLKSKQASIKRKEGKKIGTYELINGSCLNKNNFKKADYIFTDPPYGETIQYSELSLMWNAWLGFEYENKDEVIINPVQKKGINEFNNLLNVSLENIYESLNNNAYFTLCFANKDFAVWKNILRKCKELGFSLVDVSIFDTYGCPFNKNWSEFSPKSDFYITFKKGKEGCMKEILKKPFYCLNDVCDEVTKYMKTKRIKFDLGKAYDATVAFIIWILFINEQALKIEDFDIKKFSEVISNFSLN